MVELRCWSLRRIRQEDHPCTVFGPFLALEFYRTTELFGLLSPGFDISCLLYHSEELEKYWKLCTHLRQHSRFLVTAGEIKDTYASFQVAPYSGPFDRVVQAVKKRRQRVLVNDV
jgi:hypothetical protein